MEWLEAIPFIGRAVKWVWGRMMPAPEFLGVTQGIDFRNQPHQSWLHISVRLCGRPWAKKIEGCRVFVIRRWGENPPGDGIHMRWRTGQSASGEEEITLRVGTTYSVPVVWRDGDGTAFITNGGWMLSQGRDRKWPLPPGRTPPVNHPLGRYEFWLEIRASGHKWRSPHMYVIGVPPSGIGNGFFTVSAEY